MSSSTLKRPHSPTPSDSLDSSKRSRGLTTIVVLGNLSNGKRIELDGDRLTITPHDVYKALKVDLGSSNSYDLCQLRSEVEGNRQIIVVEFNDTGKEDQSTKHKEYLSALTDKYDLLYGVFLKDKRRELETCKQDLSKAREIHTYEVFMNLLRSLNGIIFNPAPTPDQLIWRGNQVLQQAEIKWFKERKKGYITALLEWKSNNVANMAMKAKALDCLTMQQKVLAHILVTQDVKNLERTNRNLSQHPRPSKEFAKLAVRKAFQDLQLNIKYPELKITDFENVIDHAPPSLSQTDPQPFFEDEEGESSPKTLEERIFELQEIIKKMERKDVPLSYL